MQEAKEAAARNTGFNRAGFFSLGVGETQIVRFLHGIDKMFIYNHGCGLANWEIGEGTRASLLATGTFVCPACNQPFADSDFVGERPGVLKAPTHQNVVTSDGKKSGYVCLEGSGFPCPLCAMRKPDGKALYPVREKVYGSAVIRMPNYENVMVNGVPTPKVVSVQDKLVEVEDQNGGKSIVPEVVIINQAYSNFWQALDSVHAQLQQSGGGGISWYDFTVTRVGEGLDTKYAFEKLSSDPMPLPFEQYASIIPDVCRTAEYFGSPEYYYSKGIAVQGFVPQQQPAQQQPQQAFAAPQPQVFAAPGFVAPAMPQPAAQPAQQPTPVAAPMPQPAAQPAQQPVEPETAFDGMRSGLASYSS
jgi:hypothetical protein